MGKEMKGMELDTLQWPVHFPLIFLIDLLVYGLRQLFQGKEI